jgi:YgiT-type zinc finger domain-containing protein
MSMYDFPCEYCSGTVREQVVDREPICLHRGIVILENVPVGICDRCGAHYYAAPVLKQAEAILKSGPKNQRTVEIPIQPYAA